MERQASWGSAARRPFSIEADGCKKLMHMAGQGTAQAAGVSAAEGAAEVRERQRVFFGTAMRNSTGLFEAFATASKAAVEEQR